MNNRNLLQGEVYLRLTDRVLKIDGLPIADSLLWLIWR
jgi:hypothetical protein